MRMLKHFYGPKALLAAAIVAGITSFRAGGTSTGTRIWDPAHGHYHDANGVQVP